MNLTLFEYDKNCKTTFFYLQYSTALSNTADDFEL